MSGEWFQRGQDLISKLARIDCCQAQHMPATAVRAGLHAYSAGPARVFPRIAPMNSFTPSRRPAK
jgi:hypothetical protein